MTPDSPSPFVGRRVVARSAVAGIALGLLGSLALSRVIASMLFNVQATDPTIFLAVAGTLIAGALLASLLPAIRATQVDPMVVLRFE